MIFVVFCFERRGLAIIILQTDANSCIVVRTPGDCGGGGGGGGGQDHTGSQATAEDGPVITAIRAIRMVASHADFGFAGVFDVELREVLRQLCAVGWVLTELLVM